MELLDKGNYKYILYFLSFIMFCGFAGFKYNVGTDYINYKYYYDNVYNNSVMSYNGVELGYVFIMKCFSSLSISFVFFWFLLSSFNFSLKYYIFHKYSPLVFASLLLYFVGLFLERDFDGIRQGLAIGFCYISIPFILNRNAIPFIIIIAIASSIHASALVFLPAYFLVNLKVSNTVIFAIIGTLVILVFANISFTKLVISILPDSIIKMRIETYMTLADSQYSQKIGISVGLLFRLFVLFVFVYFEKDIQIDKNLYYFLRNGFFVGLFISLFFNDFEILSHRLSYVFRELQIFIVPFLIIACKKKSIQLFLLTILFLYSSILLYRILNAETLKEYYEYKNYLFI